MMFSKLLKKLHSQKGAMDRILVTLLLVIIAVAMMVGLTTWYNGQKNTMTNATDNQINNALTEINSTN